MCCQLQFNYILPIMYLFCVRKRENTLQFSESDPTEKNAWLNLPMRQGFRSRIKLFFFQFHFFVSLPREILHGNLSLFVYGLNKERQILHRRMFSWTLWCYYTIYINHYVVHRTCTWTGHEIGCFFFFFLARSTACFVSFVVLFFLSWMFILSNGRQSQWECMTTFMRHVYNVEIQSKLWLLLLLFGHNNI